MAMAATLCNLCNLQRQCAYACMLCQAYSLVARKTAHTQTLACISWLLSQSMLFSLATMCYRRICESHNSLHVLFSTGQAWSHC